MTRSRLFPTFVAAALSTWAVGTLALLPHGTTAAGPDGAPDDGERAAVPTLALPAGVTLTATVIQDDGGLPTAVVVTGTNPGATPVTIDARLRVTSQDLASMVSRMPLPVKYHREQLPCPLTIAAGETTSTTVTLSQQVRATGLHGGGIVLACDERELLVHGIAIGEDAGTAAGEPLLQRLQAGQQLVLPVANDAASPAQAGS